MSSKTLEVLKVVSTVCGESLEVIINMDADTHLKSCKLLAGVILSDTNHPLRSHLSPCISIHQNPCTQAKIGKFYNTLSNKYTM